MAAPVLKASRCHPGNFHQYDHTQRGNTKGFAITLLHPNILQAIQQDTRLYAMLALVDVIRIGAVREHALAFGKFKIVFFRCKMNTINLQEAMLIPVAEALSNELGNAEGVHP